MNVLVTGATGFLARHIVPRLQANGHSVIAQVRSKTAAELCPWLKQAELVQFSLEDLSGLAETRSGIDALVHLAWSGLPDYRSGVHEAFNLPASLQLVQQAINAGVRQIQIAGTCLEYGLVEGCLTEDMESQPSLPYPIAKDRLRQRCEELAAAKGANLQWLRYFYMYGPGQNPRSLLPALEQAIVDGDPAFNMSGGRQLRDYLPVQAVADISAALLEYTNSGGIFNCASGRGITVKELVETYAEQRGASIEFNYGHYPYPDYEPMAFWGGVDKLSQVIGSDLIPQQLTSLESCFEPA